ncbi:uncharacterized protein LOC119292489 [Triticum dicoccoides]|uniref:uncharacterized protein LOC119292489 n=1 Tax=Triticum dicoccoides TaxID=85692 RepID=UPI001890ADFE|nr:uncharacterized protein LOC119292489 [Triticum dicoccoides]
MIVDQKLDFVGLSETIKQDFTKNELHNLCGGRNFQWSWNPPRGMSGGILMGVNKDMFNVEIIEKGQYFLRMLVFDKNIKMHWNLVSVYGDAQKEGKASFLAELARLYHDNPLPCLVGGDFNIIRNGKEKNKPMLNEQWSFMFNAIIEQAGLRELPLNGRRYTWANNQEDPTFEKLDRVLMCPAWEEKYPLTILQAFAREVSDHTLLFLDTGSNALEHDLVKGVLNGNGEKGVNMLQYADDTIFLIKDEVESVKNLKLILGAFEQMSGLKINFHKSELLLFGKAREKQSTYQDILTCKMGDLPIRYLGMPVSENRVGNSHWECVTNKIEKRNTRFWEDTWVDDKPLKEAYPRLYDICFDHNITVEEAIQKGWGGFKFRRTLHGETLGLWNCLKKRCEEIHLQGGADQVLWTPTVDHKFSVGSLYRKLIAVGINFPQKYLWKTKLPEKLKVFLWWLTDWSILQIKESSRKTLELGARVLEQAANEVFTAKQGWRINVARLE